MVDEDRASSFLSGPCDHGVIPQMVRDNDVIDKSR